MVAKKMDLLKNGKEYDELYPLDTKKGVISLLMLVNEVKERRFYEGDFNASDLIMDLELSIDKAGLSSKQKEVLDLLYYKCFTQKESAEILDITQQSILDRREKALRKIVLFNKKKNNSSRKGN